jgi:thioredoxin 1
MIAPVLEEVADEIEGATIVKVNVDDNSELSAEYGVRNIPVVFAIKNGEVVSKIVGAQKKDAYIKLIEDNSVEPESDESED